MGKGYRFPNYSEVVDFWQGVKKANQAFLFLVSEIGELSDALVSNQAQWVRNNPDRERHIPSEIEDVLMMLTVFAATQGIDPLEALKDKMRSKGFEIRE